MKTYGEYDFSQLRKAYSSYASQGDVGDENSVEINGSDDQSSVNTIWIIRKPMMNRRKSSFDWNSPEIFTISKKIHHLNLRFWVEDGPGIDQARQHLQPKLHCPLWKQR